MKHARLPKDFETRVKNTYPWFLDIRDGQVVKASAFFDSIAFNDLWTRVRPRAPGSDR